MNQEPCQHCSKLQPSGEFETHPTEKAPLLPFRVQKITAHNTVILGDFETIEFARSAACGNTNFKIFSRKK